MQHSGVVLHRAFFFLPPFRLHLLASAIQKKETREEGAGGEGGSLPSQRALEEEQLQANKGECGGEANGTY